jgi:hypothetical protein
MRSCLSLLSRAACRAATSCESPGTTLPLDCNARNSTKRKGGRVRQSTVVTTAHTLHVADFSTNLEEPKTPRTFSRPAAPSPPSAPASHPPAICYNIAVCFGGPCWADNRRTAHLRLQFHHACPQGGVLIIRGLGVCCRTRRKVAGLRLQIHRRAQHRVLLAQLAKLRGRRLLAFQAVAQLRLRRTVRLH